MLWACAPRGPGGRQWARKCAVLAGGWLEAGPGGLEGTGPRGQKLECGLRWDTGQTGRGAPWRSEPPSLPGRRAKPAQRSGWPRRTHRHGVPKDILPPSPSLETRVNPCVDQVGGIRNLFSQLDSSRILYGSVFSANAFRESCKSYKGDVVPEPTGDGVKPESVCTLESGLASVSLGRCRK